MTSADGGPALFRLVRFWSRRWARGVAAGAGDTAQHVLTVEAVVTRCRSGDRDGATVGDVARRLGLDQSGASRMVAAAAAAGYVERSRATADGRRSVLRLTLAGRALIDSSHRWQRDTFAELTASWDEKDRAQFAGYLQRLASEVGA
ncbi:MarR family winged helix-turn-helix transcriptional regulator [Pseudonocardia yunnanensis]|uniref:MarR family winged helix-turn-helix transcriptional regulator n=1 Tax=Pseudonocardia yunnanensis TaxID=58107 RepID=A0ABW4EKJ4_9PSEU